MRACAPRSWPRSSRRARSSRPGSSTKERAERPMHWFVTGSRGQLGSALIDRLALAGANVGSADRDDFDIADPGAVRQRLASLARPLGWGKAAGVTPVDPCEREPGLARRANTLAPAGPAQAGARAGAPL